MHTWKQAGTHRNRQVRTETETGRHSDRHRNRDRQIGTETETSRHTCRHRNRDKQAHR